MKHRRRPLHPPHPALRVVIDTNVLVSALVFRSGPPAKIRDAWLGGRIFPVVSRATTQELLRVLHYPKFALTEADRQTLLAAYLPFCETLAEPRTRKRLPECRDPDDQPFLLLAVAGGVDALITGDEDLAMLAGSVKLDIVSPAEFVQRLQGG